jgi:serine/threonine-protein kinase RIM15
MADEKRPATLLPPAVTALKHEAAVANNHRQAMERSVSQDMREEREDLKEAAEHSLNVIMDLDLENRIRYVTPQWKDVIGTTPQEVVGKSVMDIVYGGADGFEETIESVKKYDSRSHLVRFSVRMGPNSVLRKRRSRPATEDTPEQAPQSPVSVDHEEEQILNLEAQGIMIYDRATGAESHVWYSPRNATIYADNRRQCG